MFEQDLKDKFSRIFDFKKVSYDAISESPEQETLFIEVQSQKVKVIDSIQKSTINGVCRFYAPSDKIPFGYFLKRIREADVSDTKDLFFSDIDANKPIFGNIVERSFSFVYFYSGQYDPNQGTITSITTEVEQ